MNKLLSAFQRLRVSPITSRRILIGYADTEGAPHRKVNGNAIWNMNIIFRHVIDESGKELERVYHCNHIILSKNHDKKDIVKSWKVFNGVNDDIMNEHDCDQYILVFWNAPHDRAVLKTYDIEYHTIDALRRFKEMNSKYKSYKLAHICKSNKINVNPNHTAFFDAKALMLLCEKYYDKLIYIE